MSRALELNALAPMMRALARIIGQPLGRRLSVIWGALAIGALVLERAIDPHHLRRVIPTPLIQRLEESLGARFTLHLYPVTSAQRARALATLACAPSLASAILSLLLGGWSSTQNVLVTLALTIALASGHLAMVLLTRWRESASIWMWFGALALFFIAYASPWWSAIIITLSFAAGMVHLSARLIERRRLEVAS